MRSDFYNKRVELMQQWANYIEPTVDRVAA